jgi:hypothetical protein
LVTAPMARQPNPRVSRSPKKYDRIAFHSFEAYIPTIDLTASRMKHGAASHPLQNLAKTRHDPLVYTLIIRSLDRFV